MGGLRINVVLLDGIGRTSRLVPWQPVHGANATKSAAKSHLPASVQSTCNRQRPESTAQRPLSIKLNVKCIKVSAGIRFCSTYFSGFKDAADGTLNHPAVIFQSDVVQHVGSGQEHGRRIGNILANGFRVSVVRPLQDQIWMNGRPIISDWNAVTVSKTTHLAE